MDARRERCLPLDLCARRRGARSPEGGAPDLRGAWPGTTASPRARSPAGWCSLVLTCLSLWCAYGTTATQLAEKFAAQAVATVAQTSKQTVLDRLRKQRDALIFTETSAEAVKTAEDAVATAAARAADEKKRGGCGDVCKKWEKDEQMARAALLKMQADRAATVKAADLDAKIADRGSRACHCGCEGGGQGSRSAVCQHGQGDRRRSEPDRGPVARFLRHRHRARQRRWLLAGVRAWPPTTSARGSGGAGAVNGSGAHRPRRRAGASGRSASGPRTSSPASSGRASGRSSTAACNPR